MTACPTIGIVITCYNYGNYVGGAIHSALSQSRMADEIIVIDDGSIDHSRDVIRGFGGAIRSIFKENQGYAAAINQGYAESKSDILIFLDADDLLYPDVLAEVEKAWSDDLAKVQFDLDIIDGAGRLLGRRFANFTAAPAPAQIDAEFRATGTYRWPVTSGNAHSRKFLAQVMPLVPPVGHDGVLNTIAPLYGNIATIARPLGQYRLHGRNMSLSSSAGNQLGHPDFARQIGFRRQEFAILRDHAKAMGVMLPPGNLLDNELVFVNYRLMARKTGHSYLDQQSDGSFRLWWRGCMLAIASREPLRLKLGHLAWLTALSLAPAVLASRLIALRFNRARAGNRLVQAVRHPLRWLVPHVRKAAP